VSGCYSTAGGSFNLGTRTITKSMADFMSFNDRAGVGFEAGRVRDSPAPDDAF
jgi:alpha-D-ribose 1-methylphosphonate 5-triphosphate synthase subunit PhnG